MTVVADSRNVDEKAKSRECCSKGYSPSNRPVLIAGYNVNIIIGSMMLIGFGHPKQGSGGCGLGKINDWRL